MDNRSDFEGDLEAVKDDIETNVAEILQVLGSRQESANPANYRRAERAENSRESTLVVGDGFSASHTDKMKTPKRRADSQPEPIAVLSPMVNITTRLSITTNNLLTEAALRQRLKKVSPCTRQAILEAALKAWLHKNGYSG